MTVLPPWWWGIYINYLDFFCMGDLSVLPPSFISVWTHRYFYTLDYDSVVLYFVVWIVSVWPLGALLVGSCIFLTYSHCYFLIFIFLALPYFLALCKIPQVILYISLSRLRISYFPKGPHAFCWRMTSETSIWAFSVCTFNISYNGLSPIGHIWLSTFW